MAYFAHESAVIDAGARIGEGCKIWHFCHIFASAKVGKNCVIGQNCMIGENVSIGENVRIQNNVSLFSGVVVENSVFIAPSVVFTNVKNPRAFLSRKNEFRPTLIKQGASIGANATIVCGISIGAYALIGAGSVVTKDVPAFGLMVGNPARLVGFVDKAGVRMEFDSQNRAIDSFDKSIYELRDGAVVELG
ncbi:N-acetyltransferase [Helicobacter sp. MIT 00-7814]|uniref:acyltransferase n=1 Tax=unclassified Helicobacter TaxID=2593540 RepID=UPI000E1F8EE7|nr:MULTISPECIES: acyltransferase [unclassified Helicobacter]RDU54225.1 N-acetyltransferase [Helicobacter sp. MIT 00-7814]RDU56029.1 N-acetyltransferase [Helicobacter sp. MIT 99-10781]